MIYKWSSSLLRLVNRKLRNILWTGSCAENKVIRIAWHRCFKLYSQGGLGLKNLGLLNDSLLKKLTWKFMTSESFSFSFLMKRYLTQLRKSQGGSALTWRLLLNQLPKEDRLRKLRPLVIKSVIWSPPAPGWIKVNNDGAALSSPGVGRYGGIFRNCRAFVKDCFVVPLGQVFAFEAELITALMAINFAWQNGWHRI
ncbi:hypothetical protein Dsin_024696 [Dipteronia sinensis]|uniref:RNase H type-1 domain-containing protein n=1 Tax=Dipteronia sinensis TaxID=43782 RepID=A0AAD9ZV07_9ROSI|nr:hypothetical protein Dsin_024696 [Dipteronia sinensis]